MKRHMIPVILFFLISISLAVSAGANKIVWWQTSGSPTNPGTFCGYTGSGEISTSESSKTAAAAEQAYWGIFSSAKPCPFGSMPKWVADSYICTDFSYFVKKTQTDGSWKCGVDEVASGKGYWDVIVEYCGDGICNNNETCSTCSQDCGMCPSCSMSAFPNPCIIPAGGSICTSTINWTAANTGGVDIKVDGSTFASTGDGSYNKDAPWIGVTGNDLTCVQQSTGAVLGSVTVSGCAPATCSSLGKGCGSWPDGCGRTLDCGACPYCGDKICNNGETCSTCPGDCGACPAVCGNGIKETGEGCERPNTNNNINCPQTPTYECSGKKIRVRDSYGNCDSSCQCAYDSFSEGFGCRAGSLCGAECDLIFSPSPCQEKCTGNVRYYNPGCDDNSCMCTYSTENCDSKDGWYDKAGWTNYDCKRCKPQEYRDYSCSPGGCTYTVTNTRTYCENTNEGLNCGIGPFVCKDSCAKTQQQSVCSSGSCVPNGWINTVPCNPFSCSGGACNVCSHLCGSQCDENADCPPSGCSKTFNDYCNGTKLTEYNTNKIIDNTNVSNSTANTCSVSSCLCTNNSVTCNPPPINSYCVQGVCGAQCDSNDDCQPKCVGNVRNYNAVCDQNGCSCSFQSEDCSSKSGWYNASGWIPYDCQQCMSKEYRLYSCTPGNCTYNVTNTTQVCQNINEGQTCGTDPFSCKDICNKAKKQYTCQSGQCLFNVWINQAACNPYSCTAGACNGCSKLCGGQCENSSDCLPSNCSLTFTDYCNGTKLTEYNSNKILDSTNVSNSTSNTCLTGCTCTNNTVTCNPPGTHTYCVPGVCGAVCSNNSECDDQNPNTIDTCLDNCSCRHEQQFFCGDNIVTPPEQCELPNTFNNNYCPQNQTQCQGFKLGTRDAFGNCSVECGCSYDNFVYSCVKGQCGAECANTGDCANKCVGNVRYYSGTCESQETCSCSFQSENCSLLSGWYNTSGWIPYTCQQCMSKEYRLYSCTPGNCTYNVTNTTQVCQNINEGQTCGTDPFSCKDVCNKAKKQYTCQAGQCLFSVWINQSLCNPYSCSAGACNGCSKACGAQCETNGDCPPAVCAYLVYDYCNGTKLTEYNTNKILDSTMVANSTNNTCTGSCSCTNNSITCNPPETHTYCVKDVCGAQCSQNSDCDDYNVNTTDTCLGNCTCDHIFCQRDGQYGQGHEFMCRGDGTYDRCNGNGTGYEHVNICKQECSASPQCNGFAPSTNFTSCTLFGQSYLQDYCNATCKINDDNCESSYAGCTAAPECDELVPNTDSCTYQCDYKPLLCQRDGQWGEGHEFMCREDNTYDRCNETGIKYDHINVCKYYCSASAACDGYSPGAFLSSCTLFGQPYLQDYCNATCQIKDDNCESSYAACTAEPACDEKVPGQDGCDQECKQQPSCGNGLIDAGEQCELPNTQNNSYCAESQTQCSGFKLGTRGPFGNCSSQCACSYLPFTYSCVKNQCGAVCSANPDCANKCIGNIRYYSGSCNSQETCSCSFQSENCDALDGYYDTTEFQWIPTGECTEKQQIKREFRDYSCAPEGCNYIVTGNVWADTGQTRNKPDQTPCNDGLYCTTPDTCTSGICSGPARDCSGSNLSRIAECFHSPDGNPFTWDYAAGFTSVCNEATDQCTTGSQNLTHACSKLNCSAQCETNGDCPPAVCAYLVYDYCNGTKLTEYNTNKILDSTMVANSTNNTCTGSCSCTNNSITCNPPETHTYCVKDVCGAQCSQDSECDDGDENTADICLDNCMCQHRFLQLCGDGIVQPSEQCELPNTNDNSYCNQSTTQCQGFKLGTRDAFGNCSFECGCSYDNFVYSCVKGQCGAGCSVNSDCPPYIDSTYCHFGRGCLESCSCDPGEQEFCPVPGTVVDSNCYYGAQECTDEGCSILNCTLGERERCDPDEGCVEIPCNPVPAITDFWGGYAERLIEFPFGGGHNSSAKIYVPRTGELNITGARMDIEGLPIYTNNDIVLVTDVSGSMDDNCGPDGVAQPGETPCKINDVKNASSRFVHDVLPLSPATRIGLVSYRTQLANLTGLTRNETLLLDEISGYLAEGYTCISCGIRKGAEIAASGNNTDKSIILLSDGAANRCIGGSSCTEIVAREEAINEAKNAWETLGVKVHVVAFTDNGELPVLQSIADSGNGTLFVSNVTGIIDMYKLIASMITNGSYPTNASVDIGSNGDKEWNYTDQFNSSQTLADFIHTLDSLRGPCNCTGCLIQNNSCVIDLDAASISKGKMRFYNLSISGCCYSGDCIPDWNGSQTSQPPQPPGPPGPEPGDGGSSGGGGYYCAPNWSCTGWSNCMNGLQARNCSDTNKCGIFSGKPSESRSCQVPPTLGCIIGKIMCMGNDKMQCTSEGNWVKISACSEVLSYAESNSSGAQESPAPNSPPVTGGFLMLSSPVVYMIVLGILAILTLAGIAWKRMGTGPTNSKPRSRK